MEHCRKKEIGLEAFQAKKKIDADEKEKNGAKKSKGRNNDGRDSPMVAEASTFNLAEQH